jgi:hypothetical protein
MKVHINKPKINSCLPKQHFIIQCTFFGATLHWLILENLMDLFMEGEYHDQQFQDVHTSHSMFNQNNYKILWTI